MKSLVVFYSYHQNNTEKIAKVIAKVLDAQTKTPNQVDPEELQDYDVVGFGSGIYGAKHHPFILDLIDKIPIVNEKKVFIFSTNAFQDENKVASDHFVLREKLKSKGYEVIDEFSCLGFNTNLHLKFFGGMNKGKPDDKDLKNAEEFAQKIKQNFQKIP